MWFKVKERPEGWECLSLPGTKVSEGLLTELKLLPNTPVTMSLFVLPGYGGNGYGAQPMAGESFIISQGILT